jgi:catechol 2,3-dioxygenase-like lactoylglutathione lyase family enzyme
MIYIGLDITGKAPTQLHDEKEWTVVHDLRGTTTAIIVESLQKVALTVFVILSTSVSGFANSGQSITFDAPSAGTAANFGTFPAALNDLGQVVGYSVDNQNLYHGFVRYPDGRIKIVDAPGGGTTPGSGEGTLPLAVNNEGTIVGQYQDANFVYHAFVRDPDGHFITFEAPGAGSGQNQGTEVADINSEGTIVGLWIDSNNVFHGFFRSRLGALTSFDAPNAGTGLDQGTSPSTGTALSPLGVSTGQDTDGKGIIHGYVRQRAGAITSFDPPGSIITFAEGINPEGVIVGTFGDNNSVFHGFVRNVNGAITSFDVPGALLNTNAKDITLFGVITGLWNDSNNVYHGFIRYPNAAILKFDVPGAGSVPGSAQGTLPIAINFWGEIVGEIQDSSNVYHGFVRLP